MSWDVGYMGECPKCGYQLHQFAEDKAGYSAVWLHCSHCMRADCDMVVNSELANFWKTGHLCAVCKTAMEPWDASWCPRCGEKDCGQFMYMPD